MTFNMKLTGLLVLACLVTAASYGQHYYNDQVITNDIAKKRALLQQLRVRGVQMTSLDNHDEPVAGFSSAQQASGNYSTLITTTSTELSGKNETTHSFNDKGQLTRSIDTTDGNKTVIEYAYDAAGLISSITSRSFSPGGYVNKEQHLWSYASGKPSRMLKIKNDKDTTYITFTIDDKGNVGEEKSTHRGQDQPSVFYYYDDQNRLTDVVRYNPRAKRLLPDYVFEYDGAGRVSTMLVTTQGGADYQRWYYKYDEKGLKQQDICYGKNKSLIGKVSYTYRF
jgi:YD repeat-containing protein